MIVRVAVLPLHCCRTLAGCNSNPPSGNPPNAKFSCRGIAPGANCTATCNAGYPIGYRPAPGGAPTTQCAANGTDMFVTDVTGSCEQICKLLLTAAPVWQRP